MADVASSEGDDGPVSTTIESCRASSTTETDGVDEAIVSNSVADEKDMAAVDNGVVNDKVSIHEILEGMTNEFNKGVSPSKHNIDNERTVVVEETTTPLSPSKVVDETSKGEKECDDVIQEIVAISDDIMTSQSTSQENHKNEDDMSIVTTSVGKQQEIVKKDNNIPRIVLTFRTIDENTDHGKKTKISSCSSNLTLVPDELANCDQIGGVSVKIENSDENFDMVEESPIEESRTEESQANRTKEGTSFKEAEIMDENKIDDAEKKLNEDALQSPVQKKPEIIESNIEGNNGETTLAEGTEQQELTVPVTRKRRIGRPRLRALRFLFYFIHCLLDISRIFTNILIFSVILFLKMKIHLVPNVQLEDSARNL